MKKILLIEVGSKETLYPPIGLMHLAAVIRDKYEVRIKDYSGKEIREEEIKEDIEKFDPFIVGLRVLTGPPIPRAIKVSKIAKEMGKIVIWGGPHPTILPEQTLENEYIDSLIIGEGEDNFQKLIKYHEGKKVKLFGAGIKKKGKIIITEASKKSVNLDKLPLPAWDLVENIEKYFPFKKHNELPISTTRGCAFKCGFCHNSNDNVKKYLGCYRITQPERAIQEYNLVQKLVKNQIDIIDVGEDLHLISEDYAKKFCKVMKESKLDIKWTTSARYQILNEEIIKMIADAGCVRILLGIESGSERIQAMNNKKIDMKKAIETAKLLKKYKIFTTNAYIMGHPTETEEELNKTVEFIKNVPADENLIQLYRPMPGTPYFQICVEKNKFNIPNNLEEWGGFGVLGHDINVSEIPTKKLFKTFYKTNLIQQTKYWLNQQKFFVRHKQYARFFSNFIRNRFTHKLKEYLQNR
ncbi:MAG TPA: radical SAM protein [Candidatus Paceibacterota bacterium]|nr:radical SAM protein [Candidatus Paceibacterota bacterium]